MAIQQGKFAAATIRADLAGKPRRPFSYLDKGQLAVIGRGRGRLGTITVSVNSFVPKPYTFEAIVKTIAALAGYWFGIVRLPPRSSTL